MQNSNNLEELLRENACLGNVDKLGVLVRSGVSINSQNIVNGWTALHWAAKRNHKQVVSFLLQNGANPSIRSFKNELPSDVTQSEEVKQILLDVESKSLKDINAGQLSGPCSAGKNGPSNLETLTLNEDSQCTKFVPNYLQNPEFPYSESATEFATRLGIPSGGFVKQNENLCEKNSVTKFADNVQIAATNNPACSTVTEDCVLVLKCRLADSEETDFIEVELDRKCLNFEALVETCLAEFDVNRTQLKKIRKLPNAIVRNDQDVKRLVQYQEIEIVIK